MTANLPTSLANIMTREVHYVAPTQPLQAVARSMSEAGISSLLVGTPEATLGIVTESNLLRAMHWRLPGATPIAELMSQPLVSAPPDLELLAARKLLDTHRIRHLVVVANDGHTVGIVSETDFRRHLGALAFNHLRTLEGVMDHEMPRLPPSAKLAEALAQMLQLASDYVLVGDLGAPLGIITERDIPRLLGQHHDAAEITLGEAMSHPLLGITIDRPVSEALAAMASHGVRHLGVSGSDGRSVGIISQQRLFEQLALQDMESAFNRLREERERLRLLAQLDLALASAGAGLWEYQREHDRRQHSDGLRAMLGDTGNAHGKLADWRARIHPGDLADYDSALATLFGGGRLQAEYRVRHADGSWLWVEDRGYISEHDNDGQPIACAGILADIGTRHASQHRIERQNRALHLLGGLARCAVRSNDESELIASVCQLIEADGNYRRSSFHPADSTPPAAGSGEISLAIEHDAVLCGWLHLALAADVSDDDEERLLREDIAVELGLGIGKMRARQRLARSEANLRQLSLAIEQSPHGVIITNRQHGIEYVNQAFVATTGYPAAEVIGKPPAILAQGLTAQNVFAEIDACIRRGEIWRGELLSRRRDGYFYDIRATITPVRQADGEVTHYLAIIEDITERKRNLAELARYREQLESLVAQRTRQLLQAKEDAEAASRSKSRFLANMGHEIRTPMNAILGLTHLLQRDIDDSIASERLARIGDAANQLMQLFNDILDLSRLEAGNLTPADSEFPLPELIAEVSQQFADKAGSKNIIIDRQFAAGIPEKLRGDAPHIRQILQQLLSNAVKFTDTGRITIAVSNPDRDGDHLLLRFSVSDTGIGIADEISARLFNPFEQGDDSTTRRHGGVGLGLVISRRLVELLGGKIGVNSAPGVGSEFWFTLPLRAVTSRQPAIANTPPEAGATSDGGDTLDRIPGLDYKLGLHAVRGKQAVYERLLNTFAGSHLDDFEKIRELLLCGEEEEARRLAHSIKGAAGTLGATRVFEAAAAVDHAIRQQRPANEVLDLIDVLDGAYRVLHDALARIAANNAPAALAVETLDSEQIRSRLDGLVRQLIDGDFAVQARLQRDAEVLRQALGSAHPAFERKIAEYDFPAAAELLEQALNKLG